MTLVELNYILALAHEKHFGRAAQRCCVSQPTLSIAISKLEKRLGTTIFERNKNNITITEIGARIITQAQRVIEEAEKLKLIANSAQHQLNCPLKLGGIYTIAPYLFPLLIPSLKKLAPNMPLIINEDFTANLRVKLQNGDLDAIFIALPFSESNIVVKPLYEEAFTVLLPKKHALTKKASVTRNDLTKENVLLLGEGHCFRDQILESCPQCHHAGDLQQTVEGTSLETLRHMVASGMGITILPNTATQIRNYSKLLCTRPFKTKAPKRTIALAWRASFPRTKAIDTLIQALFDANIASVCPIN